MTDSNKENDKKLNTSTKPVGLSPPKGKKVDAAAAEKSKGLLDELENKLDDLFALDDQDVKNAEKRQIIKSPLDDVKETPKGNIAAAPDKNKAGKIKSEAPAPPDAATKKVDISPSPQATTPATTDPKETKVQKQKSLKPEPLEAIPPKGTVEAKKETDIGKPARSKAADKLKPRTEPPDKLQQKIQNPVETTSGEKPSDKSTAGMVKKEKSKLSEAKLTPIAAKATLPKDNRSQNQDKPVESKKEPEKTGPRHGKKKYALLKLIFGGVILVGGFLALLTFFKAPDQSPPRQPVAAPKAHKIIKSSIKAPETQPTPPTVQTIPKRPEPAVSQPDVPPAATPAHEKKPAPPTTPVKNAADEIKYFLQEWKTAWEKSAGEKGDTDAFMSFYAEGFTSNGLDKNKWRRNKAEKNRKKAWIRITLDKINIIGPLENGRYEARFTQAYQSSNYADTSNQVLVLQKEASDWKIIGTKPQTSTSSYPYSLHDGSYRTLTSTREAIEAYRKMGLEAYWTSVDLGEKGTWYRVFIGYYNNLESARRIIEVKSLTDVRPEETRYANLIGTYASEDDLQPKRRLIAESGYSPYVIMNDNGKLNLYVGAYVILKNAEKFSTELSARGIPSQVVER